MSRSVIASASKRSNKLCGNRSIASGGMNRARIDCQNGVEGKSCRHHVRQRLSVLAAMLNSSRSSWPEALPAGAQHQHDRQIHPAAGESHRGRRRTRVAPSAGELRRREYSSRHRAGHPRGLRG